MHKKIIISAPAKINLTLCVTGKRPDGYHTLKSVMQSVSLSDTVTVTLNGGTGISVSCTDGSIPAGAKNIAYRAAEAFFLRTGIKAQGIKIHIDKKIPTEAGLGGGSADGAAVLTALDELFSAGLSAEHLREIGAEVGADIPFCITGGTALCKGIGEIITPLSALPDCFIVIGKGNTGISTKEAYEKIDVLADSLSYDFDTSVFSGSIREIAAVCSNEFEAVSDVPEIKKIKEIMLENGAEVSAMSGSGSAVYGIFTLEKNPEKAFGVLKHENFFAEICRPLNHGSEIIFKG